LHGADARRADAQHVAERVEDGLELWGGGEERRYFRIGEEIAELGRARGGFGDQAQQPSFTARQEARLGMPGWTWPAKAEWDREWVCGMTGNACGEADGDAAQPVPDQEQERTGKPAYAAHADAADKGLAQALDDEGETVCRGERKGLGHERMYSITNKGGQADGGSRI
jgi:hypothetical protein